MQWFGADRRKPPEQDPETVSNDAGGRRGK
jgi:hypothetical protein